MAGKLGCCALACAVALLGAAVAPVQGKGYFSTTYGRTYYYGPTRYYFFIGGHRHYYGTRNHAQCNGHCNQDVYIQKATATIWIQTSTIPPTGAEVTFKQKIATAFAMYSISPSYIVMGSDIHSSMQDASGYRPVTFTVYMPDGASASQFSNTLSTQACAQNSALAMSMAPMVLAPAGLGSCSVGGVMPVFQSQELVRPDPNAGVATLPSLVLAAAAAVFALGQ